MFFTFACKLRFDYREQVAKHKKFDVSALAVYTPNQRLRGKCSVGYCGILNNTGDWKLNCCDAHTQMCWTLQIFTLQQAFSKACFWLKHTRKRGETKLRMFCGLGGTSRCKRGMCILFFVLICTFRQLTSFITTRKLRKFASKKWWLLKKKYKRRDSVSVHGFQIHSSSPGDESDPKRNCF